jgi:hypothetical protein
MHDALQHGAARATMHHVLSAVMLASPAQDSTGTGSAVLRGAGPMVLMRWLVG